MDDLINMMVSNASPSEISDKIKEILMQKSAENIEAVRPVVAASMFKQEDQESEEDSSPEENEESEEEEIN